MDLRIYYGVHKSPPPLVCFLIQISPVHAIQSCFFNIHFNIILSSVLRSSRWSFTFMSLHNNPVCTCPLPPTCHMPHPTHYSSLFNQPDNVCWEIQIMKLICMQFPPVSCYLLPLRHKYLPEHPVLQHPQPLFLLWCSGTKFHTHIKITGEVVVLYSLIYIFWYQMGRQKILDWIVASLMWVFNLITQKLFNEGFKPWSTFLWYPVTASILGCIEISPEIWFKLYVFVSVVVFSFESRWYYQWQFNSGLLQFRVQIIVVCIIVRGQVSNLWDHCVLLHVVLKTLVELDFILYGYVMKDHMFKGLILIL